MRGKLPEGKPGLEFVSNIKGGNVPKEFIPSVEKGFKMAMQNGPLAGYEVDSMKVTLNDGSYHDVDSDQLSFELAAKIGFKNAAKLAKFVIMDAVKNHHLINIWPQLNIKMVYLFKKMV